MSQLQGELFVDTAVAPAATTGLFAEIVFDRPLDHAYTYAVPERWHGTLAVGKRVLAPFGRGDRATTGFCVGINQTPQTRPVKEILRVVDDEPLLTDTLL